VLASADNALSIMHVAFTPWLLYVLVAAPLTPCPPLCPPPNLTRPSYDRKGRTCE
jgi:hypothetical protein